MGDFGRIERDLADQLGLDFVVTTTQAQPSAPTVAELTDAVQALRSQLRRTVICPAEHVAALEAAIETEGLAGSVKVFGSDLLHGKAFVYRGWPLTTPNGGVI